MAADLPKISSSAPDSKTFKVHVAIDFGGDGVALAYAFGQTENVIAHSAWTSTKFRAKFKPKTIILLDEDCEPIAFGKDAKNAYVQNPKVQDKWMLFERFKMQLSDTATADMVEEKQGKSSVTITDKLKATNGREVSASVVFIAAFKYLEQEAKKYLKRNKLSKALFKTLNDSDYQWILTVPAIWSDEAKNRMRQWIIKAGLVDIPTQCKIVYESDCASLAIQHELSRDKAAISGTKNYDDNKENYDTVNFRKGERYILVDAGGGTTDIACHEILGGDGEYGVKEILAPSGGPWGSCYIDDQFIKLLIDIFGSKSINSFKVEKPALMTELMDNFEATKATFFERGGQNEYNVRMPYELMCCIEDENDGDDIEDIVSRATVFGRSGCVKLDDGEYISINKNIFEIMFNHVITPTINHVQDLLNKSELNDGKCKYLCLAGGLAASPYFRFKMNESFGAKSRYRLTVISPKRPILSVVEGAAYFGITPNYIKARVLKYTYGYLTAFEKEDAVKRGIPSDHIEKKKFYNEYSKKWYVDDCISIIAKKGKLIESGAVLSQSANRRKPTQSSVSINIYVRWRIQK